MIQECNWLQGLEGGIDTSHAPILHRRPHDRLHAARLQADEPVRARQGADARGRRHRLRLSVRRHAPARRRRASTCATYHFILPFHQIRPVADGSRRPARSAGHMWVPMDDETTMVYNWEYSPTDEPLTDEDRRRAPSRQRPASTSTRRPSARSRNRAEQLPARPPGAEDGELHGDRRRSTRRTARSRRAWAPSSIAAASTWARPTARSSRRAGCCCRRCGRRAERRHAARRGADVLHAVGRRGVLPRGADWRELPAHDAARLSAAPR